MRRRQRLTVEESESDMTPMIDCVFQLIIFFVCIDFQSLEAKLPALLPREGEVATRQQEPVEKLDLRIYCAEGGRGELRWLDERKTRYELVGHRVWWRLAAKVITDVATLRTELEQAARRRARDPRDGRERPLPLTIHAYQDVAYGDVTNAVDLARDAGFEEIHFGPAPARGTGR